MIKSAYHGVDRHVGNTPLIRLRRLSELTGGDSLKANLALLLNNARLGAQIACAFNEKE